MKFRFILALFAVLGFTTAVSATGINTSARCPYGGTSCEIGNATAPFNVITLNDMSIRNGATGVVSLSLRDYADTTDDDMAHALLSVNCTTTTTGAEDCDLTVQVPTAGTLATRFLIDADGEVTITSNEFEVDGQATGSTALIFKDFDAADDDDNVSVAVNCTTATTGAEDCDVTVTSQTAGIATVRLMIDADGELTLSSNETELDGTATGSTALIIKDFDATDDDDNASITVNCDTATTGAEDCDVTVASQTAGAPTNRIIIDGDAELTLASNESELDGTATGSTALIIKDFDATDDDDNVAITVNCDTATTGAENCDITITQQIAGAATNVLTFDADGPVAFGAAAHTSATVVTDAGTVTIDGDVTLPAVADGGNGGVKNEYIGLPRIKLGSSGTDGTIAATAAASVIMDDSPEGECAPLNNGTEAAEASIIRVGAGSYKYTFQATAVDNDGLDCDVAGAHAVNGADSIGFWFRSDTTFNSGDLNATLDDGTSAEGVVVLPAYGTAGVWVWMELDLVAQCDADCADIDGFFIQATAQAPTTFNGSVIYLDSGAFWIDTAEVALGVAALPDGVLGVISTPDTEAGEQDLETLVEWTDYFVNYETGVDFLVALRDADDESWMWMVAY